MKLTFLGAAHEVTGSCTLIEVGGLYGLVDCGMEQGRDTFENAELSVLPGEISFVLLTHAHVDHSGLLPLLYKNGYTGKIYATRATCCLCEVMLRDCAHIQESDAEWKSRKAKRAGEPPVEPLYGLPDAETAIAGLRPCSYAERMKVADGVEIRFTDAGHLMGSASIEVWLTENGTTEKVVFSGDIGNLDQPIINDPVYIGEADYVITESTYGNRLHERPDSNNIRFLADCIQRTLDRGGNVVIPSFAIGRTQEILYFIRKIKCADMVTGHGDFPVYIDSPLADAATGIFLQCDEECFDPETRQMLDDGINPLVFPGLRVAASADESKQINFDPEPKVIISASGMCEAGRIRHHLKHNLWRKESTVLFVGYQSVGTTGRAICDGAKHIRLFDEDISVNAEIAIFPGISGHADKDGLLRWITAFDPKPKKIFVNHGEDLVCEEYAAELRQDHGMDASAPYSGTSFDLLAGEFTALTAGVPVAKQTAKQKRSRDAFTALLTACERLKKIASACKGMPNKELAKFTAQINSLAERRKK